MANLQGHVTNSRGNKSTAIAHKTMETMCRTWVGGITVLLGANGHFEIFMGPHDNPAQHRVAYGNVATPGLIHTNQENDADT